MALATSDCTVAKHKILKYTVDNYHVAYSVYLINSISSFCRFFTGNSATCSNKYRRLKVQSASRIKFICPNVATVLQTTSEEVSKTNKYENLWLLSNRESFDKCDTTLDINVTKPLFLCTEPSELEFYSITFQRFAALPDEQVFKQGNSYYIIGE